MAHMAHTVHINKAIAVERSSTMPGIQVQIHFHHSIRSERLVLLLDLLF